jgi:hypothetical protein
MARGLAALIIFVGSILVAAGVARSAAAREVTTEHSPRFIPAGKGQEPFNVTRHTIPISKIEGGGPPRDGIPALDNPHFLTAEKADRLLLKNDRVLGVFLNGEAKAYPIRILNWHELVNDRVGDKAILVSWCPLCGSSLVYDPVINGRQYSFGVSGLLYKRNLLLFDRQTGSLWSQLLSEAVTGPLAGSRLKVLPAQNTTWSAWKAAHPETRVLSFATGHRRDYRLDPYADHPFPRNPALLVAGGGVIRIYPFPQLKKHRKPLRDTLGRLPVTIVYDAKTKTARVTGKDSESITSFVAFLADLQAFFPEADTFKAPR